MNPQNSEAPNEVTGQSTILRKSSSSGTSKETTYSGPSTIPNQYEKIGDGIFDTIVPFSTLFRIEEYNRPPDTNLHLLI